VKVRPAAALLAQIISTAAGNAERICEKPVTAGWWVNRGLLNTGW